MTIASILLAAISVTYAPATTNDYCFIKIPATKCESYDSIDLVNSGVTLSGLQNVGTIRRCPVNGQPFEKPYKHEALAWIEEAIKERYAVVNNRTDFPYAENWNSIQGRGTEKNNPLMYGVASKVREPDFSFTNACVVANPSVSGTWAFDIETGQDVRNMIRLHYGGNTNCASITFTRLPEIARGKPVKYNHFSPVVDALKSFGSAAIRDFSMNDRTDGDVSRKAFYKYAGQEITAHYYGEDTYFTTETYDGEEETSPVTQYMAYNLSQFNSFKWFYSVPQGDDDISVMQGPSYNQMIEDCDRSFNVSNIVWISNVKTNALYAGGFSRIGTVRAFVWFYFNECVYLDSRLHVESQIRKRVVFPTNCTFVFGENCPEAVSSVGIDNARGRLCVILNFDFNNVQERIASAAGSTWRKALQYPTPPDLTKEDFKEGGAYRYKAAKSIYYREIEQYVYGPFLELFYDVNFRMK